MEKALYMPHIVCEKCLHSMDYNLFAEPKTTSCHNINCEERGIVYNFEMPSIELFKAE